MAGLAMGLFIPSALAQLKVTSTHGGNFVQGQPTALYTLSVQNTGAAATNAVSVTDSLPLGLTATAISGPGWQCSLANLNCFRSDALAAGGTYQPITVTVSVASGVTSPLTNQVSAATSGGTVTASDSTTIIPTFTDVFASSPDGFLPFIDLLRETGITTGCQASPPMYCPNDNIPESQMAVFVIRSVNGDDNFAYTPTPYFTDVPATNLYFPWIQKMQDLGIGLPCTTTQYCPDSAVTRGIMAVLIIRSRFGVSTPTSYPATPYFTDVPSTHPNFAWIQKMKQLGITSGCTPTTYCPDDPVTRGQMAVFIMRGEFNQGLQDPTTPVLVWAYPAAALPGQTVTVTIVGQNTNFAAASQVNVGPGVAVGNVNVANGTTLTVQLTVAGNAELGPRSITVTTGAEEATLPNRFRVTSAPAAPGNLTATAASAFRIGLSWTASTSAIGLANYIVQRCQGAGCSSFAQIASFAATTTTYTDTGLTTGTSYSYRVQASDTSGNLGAFSNVATTTTQGPAVSAPLTTSVGTLVVTGAQLADSYPAGCTPSRIDPSCIAGHNLVITFQMQGGGAVPDTNAVFNASATAYVLADGSANSGKRFVVSESFVGGSTVSTAVDIGFFVPTTAKKFQLFWPGNNPIDLSPFLP